MFKHGTFIGDDNAITKLKAYNFFVYYFDNPVMKKIGNDTNGFVLYGCRIPTHLAVNSKYIIASIEASKAPSGDSITLDRIDWSSLQTRMLDVKYNVPNHTYSPKSDDLSSAEIGVSEKSNSMYKYTCKKIQGLVIALLFSKSQTRVYSDTGMLKTAIETYNTIFMV